MVAKRRTIDVTRDSDIARLLEDPAALSTDLVIDGKRFRLVRVEEEEDDYDPEAARRILAETAGAWADIDTDRLIEELYRARLEGSRPINRPEPL